MYPWRSKRFGIVILYKTSRLSRTMIGGCHSYEDRRLARIERDKLVMMQEDNFHKEQRVVDWIAGVHKIRGVSARHRQRKQDVNEQEPVQAGYQAISLRVKLLKLSCRSDAKAKGHRQALRNGKRERPNNRPTCI